MKLAPLFALVALPLALSLGGCAQPDRPENGRGGVDFTPEEVLAGAELGPLDSCDACCEEDHQIPWCDSNDGGGGGTAGGGSGPIPYVPCYWSCGPAAPGSESICDYICPGGGSGNWP